MMPVCAGNDVRRDVFRRHALDGALLHFHPASGTHIRIENDATAALRRQAPRVAMFGITNKCNLTCDFCSRDVQRESAWTVQSAAAALRGLSQAGTLEVAFGGGEPFAFRGFADLVEELYTSTPLVLNVTTNGTLFDEKTFAPYAGRFGQVRISIYDDPRWRAACQALAAHGQRWGANLIVDDAVLQKLPALLAELAALGCHDLSLLSYVGADPRKHLSMGGRARLAALIDDAPIACRLSVCFGDSIAVPRLFDGMDGHGDCGAGLDFVSITPDQRMQGCSFHDGGLPASTAQEILAGWRTERTRLTAPSMRDGCVRRAPSAQRTRSIPAISIWQAFSGNNSGECIMVAKFQKTEDASAYLAQLLPGWTPESAYSEAWKELLVAEGVASAPLGDWIETPRELLAIGRSVFAIGYAADDMLQELRALAWKKGAYLVPGGVHVHDGLWMLAAVRAASDQDARALADIPPHSTATTYLHGDLVLVALPLLDGEQVPESIGDAKKLLTAFAGPRPFAAEVLFEPFDDAAMIAVKKRLGAKVQQQPRLAVGFWGQDAEAKTAAFAQMVTEGAVTVAGTCVLISGIQRRKRLAVLAYRRGAYVSALDWAEVVVNAHFECPAEQPEKGRRSKRKTVDEDALKVMLAQRLSGEFRVSVTPVTDWGYGPTVKILSSNPEMALGELNKIALDLNASLHAYVEEIDPLASAVHRVIADVRN